jgi:outer membrane protein OmpA-like peptidoglycan-associated protein
MAGVMVVTKVKPTKPSLPPLAAADRATLEQPITFARTSATLSPAMDALVVAKSKILERQPGFAYWVTGTGIDFPTPGANTVLSEKRSAAVMHILEGRTADKKRLNRFSLGNETKRGAGVFFEIRALE